MDLLQDILQTAGLRKRILNRRALFQPWGLRFPCPHSMGFHVVLQGEGWLWQQDGSEPLLLRRGDIAFMARGTAHQITTHRDPGLLENAGEPAWLQSLPVPDSPAAQPLLTLVSGAYQLWHDPLHPIFQELPTWTLLQGEQLAYAHPIQQSLQVLSAELSRPDLGSASIVEALLDVLFHLILRHLLQTKSRSDHPWAAASADPYIGQALQLMHSDLSQAWSLQSLAQAVGLSRSGFALRFKQTLGESPLRYLNTLRMQQAMQWLSTPGPPGHPSPGLESIARQVGYQDAFAFSKAFKKAVGLAPRDFRQKSQAEQALGWRFS